MPVGVGTEVIIGLPYIPNVGCPQAGDIITAVRDMVPDPVYDEAGLPLPDTDGDSFRASTLYRWLSGGIRELTRRSNWMVLDWTAVAQEPRQQIYSLDRRFINVDGVFCNQYRLTWMDELHSLYPSYSVAQPLWYSWHHRSDHLELALWPAPDRTEPVTHLMSTIDPLSLQIDLSSTEGFLPFGYVQIGDELLLYSDLLPPPTPPDPLLPPPAPPLPPARRGLRVVKRGMCGTPASYHFAGTVVTHLSLWCRGWRVPSLVTRSTDCIELPLAFLTPLETYLLARVKEAEQDRQGAQSLMQEFLEQTNSILGDPVWQLPHTLQVRAYGESYAGPIYGGRVIVP